jgi:hypothetical protein
VTETYTISLWGEEVVIHLAPAGLKAKIMEELVGDETWGELNSTEWHGLGLTDPIKKVEVSGHKHVLGALRLEVLGQMVVAPSLLKSQGSRQTAHRLLQLFCRCGHQEHLESK